MSNAQYTARTKQIQLQQMNVTKPQTQTTISSSVLVTKIITSNKFDEQTTEEKYAADT